MRIFRSISVATFAVLIFAGASMAQEKSSALLNAVEVRQLVTRGAPGDGARLGAHFRALAEQYTAEARRHLAMGKSFGGNPSRNLGTGMSMHCQRLADLSARSADTVRQLANFHDPAGADAPAARPADVAKYEGGAGAPAPTDSELIALAAKASTPADHRVLEQYFRAQATRHLAEVKQHVAMAQSYRGTRIASAAVHHDRLAELARESAKEATAAADMHRQMEGMGR